MKNNILVIIILFAFCTVNAQNDGDSNPYHKNNEIKLNLIVPLSGALEVGFERYLKKNSSLGISAFFVYDGTKEKDMNYYISPSYRYYFGKKYASGFFAEGFGMLTNIDGKKLYRADNVTFTEGKDIYDIAVGAGFGWKLISKKGIVLEANTAYGRLVFNANKTDHNQVIKLGISIGYRF